MAEPKRVSVEVLTETVPNDVRGRLTRLESARGGRMDAKTLETAAGILGGELSGPDESGTWSVEVPTDGDRKQAVEVYSNAERLACYEGETEIYYARSEVGPLTDVMDTKDLLGKTGTLQLSQVRLAADNQLVVEGSLPAPLATAEGLALLISETASRADSLENEYFGVDED